MTRGVLTAVRAAVKAGAMDVVEKPYRMDARRSTDVGGSSDILALLPFVQHQVYGRQIAAGDTESRVFQRSPQTWRPGAR
jgi:hypothetical protein